MARGFLMLLSATAVLSGPAVAAEGPSEPFQIEQLFGSRPVIDAMLNGRPYRMIVHANAGSYVQVNHAEARTLAVAGMVHRGDYGLEAPGQVSALGRDDGVLQSLEVAGRTRTDVPVAVFERPAGSAEGMLGLPWLTDNDVIIDYASNRITLPEDAAEAERYGQALEAQGYRPHALMRDSADGRYLIVARIDGQSMPLVVSTVAGNDLDIAAAELAGIELGFVSGRWGGPGGAVGQTRQTARPVTLEIGAWRSLPTMFSVYDIYAYAAKPRPYLTADGRAGALGADFLIANQAVIDFGLSRLYLKPAAP